MNEESSLKQIPEKRAGKKINPVVYFLTISDVMIMGGLALIMPIFAVFITGQVKGGSLEVVGIAEGIYLAMRSLCQIPFGRLIDRIKGEKDDFYVLLFGSLAISLIPLAYIFCDTPLKIYIVQFFYGIIAAAALPTWLAIFTRHIDKDREGLEWGLYQTFAGLSAAVCASLGGFLATQFGFKTLFITVSVFSFFGSLFLFGIYSRMRSGGVMKK
jgi:MFS family permease